MLAARVSPSNVWQAVDLPRMREPVHPTGSRFIFEAHMKLDAAARNKLPAKAFAGPDRSYPVEDESHAKNAKSRAKQQLNAGRLSQAAYNRIVAKANKKLGKSDGDGDNDVDKDSKSGWK